MKDVPVAELPEHVDLDDPGARWRLDLTKDIRVGDERDDHDMNYGAFPDVPNWPIAVLHPKHPDRYISTSDCNVHALGKMLARLGMGCKSILEIGVDAAGAYGSNSATALFRTMKPASCIYLGVDIDDKSYLDNEENRIHTVRTSSDNVRSVMSRAKQLGISTFDFIFIDGWHSINQVMKEWEYTKWLSPGGIVGFHDTATHPGPHLFVKHLNRTRWEVVENSCSFKRNDYGIGFAWRKVNG